MKKFLKRTFYTLMVIIALGGSLNVSQNDDEDLPPMPEPSIGEIQP